MFGTSTVPRTAEGAASVCSGIRNGLKTANLNRKQSEPVCTGNLWFQGCVNVVLMVLQALRERVHGVAARLGSEVKDGAVARRVEDASNELQRQMGELERNIREHQRTLDLTCRLQRAMEKVQLTDQSELLTGPTSDHLLLCIHSISSGVKRRALPSLGSGSTLWSVAALKPSRFCTGSSRSLFGPRFLSRRRGSVRSQSWLSGCMVGKKMTNTRLLL